jgi:3-oxoacyl-[acyl-carrier protein] reductase
MSACGAGAGSGRVAIVTGGSRGIGRETGVRLAKDGFGVVVNFASDKDDADAAVTAISDAGGNAIAFQPDGKDDEAVARMARRAPAGQARATGRHR